MNRRSFLKGALGASGLLLGAACTAPATPSQPNVAPPPSAAPSVAPSAVAAASPGAAASPAASASATPPALTLDQQLAFPDSLVQAAQQEGKINWISSITQDVAVEVGQAFTKRYPGITLNYQEASEDVRTVRTLEEFQAGHASTDMVMGIGGFINQYEAVNALIPLTSLPVFPLYEPPYRDTQALWIGGRTQFWGLAFNTDNVQLSDLPQTWDGLTDPKWKGRLALGDRPQLWLEQRWNEWGQDRTTTFLQNLFANQPQRRQEGIDAAVSLLAAGEFDLYVPAAPYQAENTSDQGGAVAWGSPDPLNLSPSEVAILSNAPNPNAAKLFANWFLSIEGQSLYCNLDKAAPTHPAIREDPAFLGKFSAQLIGHPWDFTNPDDEHNILPAVQSLWSSLWTS